jgi:hypothetical protein
MPLLELSLLAQSYSNDRESNALSIFNIIENILIPKSVPDPPAGQQIAVAPQISVVQRWTRSEREVAEKVTGRIQVLGPSGNMIGGGEYSIDLSVERRSRSMMNFPFFPFVGEGDYRFVTEVKAGDSWLQVHEFSISVTRSAN